MRRFALLILAGLAVLAVSLVSFLVLMGNAEVLDRQPLVARVTLAPFALPAGYAVDPVAITDELVARMRSRVDNDMALQMMLGTEESVILREQAVPRLVNAGVLRRMLEEMEGLGTVIEMADYHALAEVEIRNRGTVPLEDVALVLPGAGRIEGIAGAAPVLEAGENGLAAVTLPALQPGEVSRFRLWLVPSPEELAVRAGEIRLGAATDPSGTVHLYSSQTKWNGAALQVLPWARWLIAGLLGLMALGSLAAVALSLGAVLRKPRRA